jgi:CRISPR-associated protein Cmr1
MEMKITLKTLTPLWTGGVDQTCDRLHETGLIGSLRWWYEALVRGLGGYACDPTEHSCTFDEEKYRKSKADDERQRLRDAGVCDACQLFGCTGWARKFRLRVLNAPKVENRAIAKGQSLQVEIIPLRKIENEEWCLLSATFRLISKYGAIGGKTIFKPSDEQTRQHEFHHLDFGLVTIEWPEESLYCTPDLEKIREYVISRQWRSGTHKYQKDGKEHDYSWASLQNFWFVGGRYLARKSIQHSTYNRVLGRKEDKSVKEKRGSRLIRWRDFLDPSDDISRWLAGSQQESKKVFSFKEPARTFGFVKPGLVEFEEVKKRLKRAWPDFDAQKEFLTDKEILKDILTGGGAA